MTVKELIEQLKSVPGDAEVGITLDSIDFIYEIKDTAVTVDINMSDELGDETTLDNLYDNVQGFVLIGLESEEVAE